VDETVRDAFKAFAADDMHCDFGALTNSQIGRAFARFYIQRIHNVVSSPRVDEEDFEAAYVDGSGDLGVDLVVRDNGKVFLLQSKYYGARGGPSSEDINHFRTALTRLRDRAARKGNRRLHEAIEDIDWANDTFEMRFVALARLTPAVAVQAELDPELEEALEGRVDYQVVDEVALKQALANARSLGQGIPDDTYELVATGRRGNRSPVVELEGPHRACVLIVDAHQLIQVADRAREALFTLNIRNFLGSTKINKEITKTARQQPAEFFHYNNGISCLAKRLTVTGDRVSAVGLQVINGAQTVRALKAASRGRDANNLSAVQVLVRITEALDQYGANRRFADQIVRYNNTQNPIKNSDFRSNDPVQQALATHFGSGHRDGRSVVYLAKRSDRGDRRNIFWIPMEEFAKVVYAFLFDAVSFSGQTAFLFADGPDGGYARVFGDGREVWVEVPTQEFRLRSAVWWIDVEFQKRLKADKAGNDALVAPLERRWFLLGAAREILKRNFGDEYTARLIPHFKGDWHLGEGEFGLMMERVYTLARDAVVWCYGEAKRMEGAAFSHRNWTRSPRTVEMLDNFTRTGPGMTPL
jgi:hypothetical protein